MILKKWFKWSSNSITSVKLYFKSLFDLCKWTKSGWKKEKGWTSMSGFVNLVAVFTLWLAGGAAWSLHKRPENKMNKRTEKQADVKFTSLIYFNRRNSWTLTLLFTTTLWLPHLATRGIGWNRICFTFVSENMNIPGDQHWLLLFFNVLTAECTMNE